MHNEARGPGACFPREIELSECQFCHSRRLLALQQMLSLQNLKVFLGDLPLNPLTVPLTVPNAKHFLAILLR